MDVALQMYDDEFSKPRYTIHEMKQLCQAAGFHARIELSETSGNTKYLPLTRAMRKNLSLLKQRHPGVTKQEALSRNAILICSKK